MHLLKEGQKIRAWVDPPPPIIRAMPERKRFFALTPSLNSKDQISPHLPTSHLVRILILIITVYRCALQLLAPRSPDAGEWSAQ